MLFDAGGYGRGRCFSTSSRAPCPSVGICSRCDDTPTRGSLVINGGVPKGVCWLLRSWRGSCFRSTETECALTRGCFCPGFPCLAGQCEKQLSGSIAGDVCEGLYWHAAPQKEDLPIARGFSYGLYSFAYPIQQPYSALFPGCRVWWMNALVAITLGLIYVHFSWCRVEKPILARRQELIDAVSRIFRRGRSASRESGV